MEKVKTILVIDDDPNIRELLYVNLVAQGYAIETADDGKTGLTMIRRKSLDLIILDVMMPETDGWEVCKAIKDDPITSHLKVMMLTAKGSDKDRMIGREIFGADEYMAKPFDIDKLLETVKRLLNG